MRDVILVTIALAIGAALGTGQYLSATSGERNVFQVTKLQEKLPQVETTPDGKHGRVEVVNDSLHDFGSMDKGEEGSHTFVIRNAGDGDLQLKLLDTSCKCTLAKFDHAVLKPGEEKEVTLEWKTVDYSETFSQNARIQTNDPTKRQLELRVIGRVVVPIRPIPEAIAMGNFQVANGFDVAFDIHSYRSPDLKVTGWRWVDSEDDSLLSVELQTIGSDDPIRVADPTIASLERVRILGRPGLPIGPFRRVLEVTTDPPTIDPILIPVSGSGVGAYTIDTLRRVPFDPSRNMIELGAIPSRQDKTVEISLVVRGEMADSVTVDVDPEGYEPAGFIEVKVKPKQRFGAIASFPIEVRIVGNGSTVSRLGPTPDLLGKFTLRTDDPTTPKIEVYIKFALVQ